MEIEEKLGLKQREFKKNGKLDLILEKMKKIKGESGLRDKFEILSIANTLIGLVLGIIKLVKLGSSVISNFGSSIIVIFYYIGTIELYVLIFGFLLGSLLHQFLEPIETVFWVIVIIACVLLTLFTEVKSDPLKFWGAVVLGIVTMLYATYKIFKILFVLKEYVRG